MIDIMKGFIKKEKKEVKAEEPEKEEEVKPEPPRERGHYTVYTPGEKGVRFTIKNK